MPCHAPHKNQRQVLLPLLEPLLLLLHGLLAESPLGSPAASLLIWFVGSAGGGGTSGGGGGATHAPCWNSSRHFVMLFMTILYSLLLALTYFLSRTVNKTKNHFRCNVAFFVCPSRKWNVSWKAAGSELNWTDPTPVTAIAIAMAIAAWNLSLSTHHLHFEHKQQDEKKFPQCFWMALKTT